MLIDSVLEAVGRTPLVRLKKMSSGNVFAKAEFLNPGGSIKDRVAKHIIESAEKEGKLNHGMIIIEATSGNTGIGDGFIPAVLDVNLIDMVFTISDEEAIETTRRLSREEGLLVGTSSGANVFAALHMDNGRNRVVTILPDRAERYFSTALL